MVNLCYSDPELAFSGGLEYFEQEEQTVYICEVKYPSGVEYILRKKKVLLFLTDIDKYHDKNQIVLSLNVFVLYNKMLYKLIFLYR